jgi:hypothetical protein
VRSTSFSAKHFAYSDIPKIPSHSPSCCAASLRGEVAFDPFRFGLDDRRDRAFEGLAPPALEGFFIASNPVEDRTS